MQYYLHAIFRHFPKPDVPKRSALVDVLRSRRELLRTEGILQEKGENQKLWKNEINRKWEEFNGKLQDLEEYIVTSEKFLNENKNKRRRAHQTIETEKLNNVQLNDNVGRYFA